MKSAETYTKEMHKLGRIGASVMIVLLIAVPTIFGIAINAIPTFGEFIVGSGGLILLFLPLLVAEVFMYTPILGSGAYITFITGNVMNIKIPIANNAQNLMNTEKGTQESDVITTLAISVSAMVTISLIAIGVLLLVPLKPFMTSAAVSTASEYILPALFGALFVGLLATSGKVKVKGKVKAGAIPFVLLLGVNLFIMDTYIYSGALLLVMIPLTILSLYQRKLP